jgi:hypothetical protein
LHFWQHITLISYNPNLLKFSKHLCAEACWTVEKLKALKQILLSAMAVSTFRKLASPVKRKREKLEFLWTRWAPRKMLGETDSGCQGNSHCY